ncbi:MAG: hypothetical protein ACO3AY_06620 [Chitinophagaceae bacterium]|jgi:hypothetical protein
MHTLEPFYNWRHLYVSENDKRSPFYKREYSEFEFSQTIYNYFIHPQWDDFGSRTLYLKVLLADYEEGFAIIELIGEWNDAIENDIMELKWEVLEKFMAQGIYRFILISENVLNFHSDNLDYYEELEEELRDNNGWIACLNLPPSTRLEFERAKINRYLSILELYDWRTYTPFHLLAKLESMGVRRIEG